MQRKLMLVFTVLAVFSLLLSPIGTARAQGNTPPPRPLPDKPVSPPVDGARQDENGRWYMPAGAHASAQEVTPLATGGPDLFGYTWDDSVPFSWIDTTTGTNTGLTGYGWGSGTGLIPLPFPFKFYENTYTGLYIAASGYVGFTDSYWEGQQDFPAIREPNNVIAPFWVPTNILADSWVHYKSGGTAPNRYFVVEWHNVRDDYSADNHFSFEVILHENNDIVFQYGAMTLGADGYSCASSGIEDASGMDGLVYVNLCNTAPSNDAVRFYRPPVSARVKLTPFDQGSFAQPDSLQTYQIEVHNTGELGDDVFDLAVASTWPVTLYAADGTTELTDTDTDTIVDTGTISQGGAATIIASVQVPAMAGAGDFNFATITATSSVDANKDHAADIQTTVPAPYAGVFFDSSSSDLKLDIVQPDMQMVKNATSDWHFGEGVAVTRAPNGNLIYVWANSLCLGEPQCNIDIKEIEYAILDQAGNVLHPAAILTDNSAATMNTYDFTPSVAVAANGTIGIIWRRNLYNYAVSPSQRNNNIYFATLSSSGALLSGPTSITQNNTWSSSQTPGAVWYQNPTIAASGNNFTLAWGEIISNPNNYYNIWYTVRSDTGGQVFAPAALTTDNYSYNPILNSLNGSLAIVTWEGSHNATYAVLNNTGGVIKPATTFGISDADAWFAPDATLLPGGKVALAWPTYTGVGFAILNSTYDLVSGPVTADTPIPTVGWGLSVTTDLAGHVIMTWQDNDTQQNLYYALGDSSGAFVTPPMLYRTSTSWIDIGFKGQGTTYNTTFGDVPPAYWSATWIERLYNAGITGGCATSPNLLYCPANPVNRAQMAIFLLRAEHGSDYVPPAATGIFEDVPAGSSTAPWIEQLYNEGITGGCSTIPLRYCPSNPVNRAQMAIFLLRAEHGSDYTPPAATGIFTDVPADSFTAPFIEQLSNEGITGGCSLTPLMYCPAKTVTRDQMSVFLVRTFKLP